MSRHSTLDVVLVIMRGMSCIMLKDDVVRVANLDQLEHWIFLVTGQI